LQEWVQAGGVILAIMISVVTYVVTNRRDDKKWLRDHLLEACVKFLDGSFDRYSKRAYLTRVESLQGIAASLGKLDVYRKRADDGLRQQNDALTHLRLLASARIVDAAIEVMKEDAAVAEWFGDPDETVASWEALNQPRQEARKKFLDAYRTEFKLDPAVRLVSR
jgi:hypothetical protein